MKKYTRLLLLSVLGLVLVAPPAYPQKTQDQLNALMADSLNLQNTVKHLQQSLDQKHAETTKLLQEVLNRFVAIDSSVKTLNDSLTSMSSSIKTSDEKSARDLVITRAAVESLRKNLDDGILGLQSQVRTLNNQVKEIKTVEQPLPTATQLFQQAYGDWNAGFYSVAVDGFREFLRNYPNDAQRSPEAQFYIGDSLFNQRKFDQAVVEFDMTLSKYPTSGRKCLALYRKGQALVELKQIPPATAALQSVVKECPGTQEATNATADLKVLPRGARGN